jgi:predicted dinucleotide-binding enzyme
MEAMKIGVLGTGDVGRAIGSGFLKLGHEVKLGSRDAANEKAAAWAVNAGPQASAGSFADVARWADLISLATLWGGTENALRLAGIENFADKVVIDATNPLNFPEGKGIELALGHTDSGGEQIQRWIPKARVVKAFNTVGFGHFWQPEFPCGPPDMFICGNDAGAKATVAEILKGFGWPAIDIGGMEGARLLEPMCMLWVGYAIQNSSRNHAFKLLRK